MPADDTLLGNALTKRAQHRGLTNSELGALHRFDHMPRRAVSNNYRPLGVIVSRYPDRINEIPDRPPTVAGIGLKKVTLKACDPVSGVTKLYDFYVARGPY